MASPSRRRRPILVWANPFEETVGGALALLVLADRLHQLGEPVALWPFHQPPAKVPTSSAEVVARAKAVARRVSGRRLPLGPFEHLPVARARDAQDAIVVYPEVIAGNPVGAPHVVRWFLYHPTGAGFGPDETYFFYQDAFDDPAFNPDRDHRLTVTYVNPAYRAPDDDAPRTGTCYLVRKGTETARGRDLDDEPCVDGLSHAETAEVFRLHEYLRCFDLYTMYATYAAVCGCVPVMEPAPGVTRDDWYPDERDRYGLAYGWDPAELEWARRTRPQLMERLEHGRRAEDEMVRRFVEVVRERYP